MLKLVRAESRSEVAGTDGGSAASVVRDFEKLQELTE
jgi:hypothetical protein